MSKAPATSKNSFGQTLQFITDVKLEELEKQRISYQAHAKVLEEARELGEKGEIVKKVAVLAKAVKSWTGSGALQLSKIVGGKLRLSDLDFWLDQAQNDPSFSIQIAEGWAATLEEYILHNVMRFDSAKLFGNLFNEWLASGDSVALAYQSPSEDVEMINASDSNSATGSEFVEVGRKEMYEQKEKLQSIIFEDHPVDIMELNAYLEDLFSSEEAAIALEKLRKDLKVFGYSLQRTPITTTDVRNTITGLLATGLMDEEKRMTLKSFFDNPTVLTEVASVLNMRMAGLDTWAWPKDGIFVEFRRHLNGKYRAFTDPDIIDGLLLHYIGVAWQVKLKSALTRLFHSKAWLRPNAPAFDDTLTWKAQLHGDNGYNSIESARENHKKSLFFLAQFQDSHSKHRPYDDLVDTPADSSVVGPAAIKQQLLAIMTTECYLNTALHGTHATVCSDLEWFGPSLPHLSVLTVLEFMGMNKLWLSFYQAFLATPLRFPGDQEPRIRKRGTPISYSLSIVCGEAVIFIMDLAVNQRANGLYLYRMHDDLWIWDANVKKVAAGWAEMNKYASIVGLKFNMKKTGSAYVGPSNEDIVKLPVGGICWGFLKFDAALSRFVIDQANVDEHIAEMRRQLASASSVFGWVNAYNKYMAFFFRNFGGTPANCFGQDHIVSAVETLARIQRELFPGVPGGAVGYLRKTLEERFGVRDLPEGYFYFPIASGGLELRNTMLEFLALERHGKPIVSAKNGKRARAEMEERDNEEPDAYLRTSDSFYDEDAIADKKFPKRIAFDAKSYEFLKENWVKNRAHRLQSSKIREEFLSFDEYTALRETWLSTWGLSYRNMLELPKKRQVVLMPKMREAMNGQNTKEWTAMDWYQQWVVSMYGEEVVKKFGGLDAVDPNLIPVGMAQLFRSSRMKLDQ